MTFKARFKSINRSFSSILCIDFSSINNDDKPPHFSHSSDLNISLKIRMEDYANVLGLLIKFYQHLTTLFSTI